MGIVVFVVLALAAFMTAFYTTRQIAMTFAGKPRSPLAEHAHESNNFMTIPLILLSVFAIGAGWFGIPDNFLGTDGVFTNHFHHFIGATVEETLHELHELHIVGVDIHTLPFDWVPLLTSVVVALGGIFVGYLMYWRNPMQAGDVDPLIRPLGAFHKFFNRKWYWDELYQTIFIKPVVYFSEVIVYEWVDQGLINGTLHLIANVFYTIGAWAKRLEELVFGDGVDWVKDQFLAGIKGVRNLQTGKIQEYALYSGVIATGLAFLIIFFDNYGWWDLILNRIFN
jgi:NADH-quinone oxidoreductase subunit L